MSVGYECRSRLIKQVQLKPTQPRLTATTTYPGPLDYKQPEIIGGKGFSKIRRAPAYTFGIRTPLSIFKSKTTSQAPLFDVSGMTRKGGRYKIKHGVVSPFLDEPSMHVKIPGPGAHDPNYVTRYKKPPAYTMQPSAKPPYEAWDMWTPSCNMYWPPIFNSKKAPSYSFGMAAPKPGIKPSSLLGPGEHDPNFDYVKKRKPAFAFGTPHRTLKTPMAPAPNAYCEKKFLVSKKSSPAPSFGIKHSPYLGKSEEYLMNPNMHLIDSS